MCARMLVSCLGWGILAAPASLLLAAPATEQTVTGIWGENEEADHRTRTMDTFISRWEGEAKANWGAWAQSIIRSSGTPHTMLFYFDVSDLPRESKVVRATLEFETTTYFEARDAEQAVCSAFVIRDPDGLGKDIPGGWVEGKGDKDQSEGANWMYRCKKLKVKWSNRDLPGFPQGSFEEHMKLVPEEGAGFYACVNLKKDKPLDTFTVKRPSGRGSVSQRPVLDLTAAVAEWVSGKAPNHGIAVLGIGPGGYKMWVTCREASKAKERPLLRITYVPSAEVKDRK